MKMTEEEWTNARNLFRDDVLNALDNAARKVLNNEHALGATDADLPELFRKIDTQFKTVMRRYGREESK